MTAARAMARKSFWTAIGEAALAAALATAILSPLAVLAMFFTAMLWPEWPGPGVGMTLSFIGALFLAQEGIAITSWATHRARGAVT